MSDIYSTVTADLAALTSAITIASPLKDASLLGLAPVIFAAQRAKADIDAALLVNDLLIDTSGVAGIAAGVFAPTLAAQLIEQIAMIQNEVVLLVQKGAVGRILVNLNQAPG